MKSLETILGKATTKKLRDRGIDVPDLPNYGKAQIEEIIGPRKADLLLACVELSKDLVKTEYKSRSVSCSNDIFDLLRSLFLFTKQEQFRIACLDTRNHVIKEALIGQGTDRNCLVSPVDVFRVAIQCGSTRIVLMHNHPSGDPAPSGADQALTKRLAEAGELLGITVLDHIVFGDNCFASFRDIGLLT